MKEVALKVHALSRAVLLAEYGQVEPLTIGTNDLIFPILTSAPVSRFANVTRAIPSLSENITIRVNPEIALNLFEHPYHPGAALYKLHLDMMCRFANAIYKRNGEAWSAIQEWLDLNGIEEDMYSMEAAYKYWQRWNKKYQAKSPVFFGRLRERASDRTPKYAASKKMLLPACEIEACLEEFINNCHATTVKLPKVFSNHARLYLYRTFGGLSIRQTAAYLDVPQSSVDYASRTMRNWIDTTEEIRIAFEQCQGLPVKEAV